MDIAELLEKKKELREAILRALHFFEQETGTTPEVSVHFLVHVTVDGQVMNVPVVDVTVRL